MTSASLLIVIVVGMIVGGLTGLALGGTLSGLALAIVAGFVSVLFGAVARNVVVARGAGAGPDTLRTPALVIFYGLVASLGGSGLGVEIAQLSGQSTATFIGALAGLFSAILMALLMITYHTRPGEPPVPVSGRPRL